jgi:hypothetical protein
MPQIDGLSARAMSEIAELEHSRNYLFPGDVAAAVRLWREYVHRPVRALWHEDEWGMAHAYCCADPLEGRALLDRVMGALPRASARELRAVVERFDAVYERAGMDRPG